MSETKKKFTIVGNWKMNPDTLEEAKALFSAISRKAVKATKVSVIIAPPAPFIYVFAAKKNSPIRVSAQDVSSEPRGAFTGAVSAKEMATAGAEFTIVGHSERRAAGDTDGIVAKKAALAIEAGLRVILCVGEKERDEQAHYLRAIREQIVSVIGAITDKKKVQWLTFAYEPVWAIGKSYANAMQPSDIHEMSLYIKKVVAEALGNKKDGLKISVLYGGSVNFENAQVILSEGAIDGLLIGRQSLDAEAIGNIIDYANRL